MSINDKMAYDVIEAAEQANVSKDLIRRGIASTNPKSFPPPLRAKKLDEPRTLGFSSWPPT